MGPSVAERNARVARRAIGEPSTPAGNLSTTEDTDGQTDRPTLVVPSGVAITAALIEALPAQTGTWALHWDGARPPIIWRNDARPPDGLSTVDCRLLTALVSNGAALDVSTLSARRRSAWRPLRESGKSTDGWLARHVHRTVRRVFSYMLLAAGAGADLATLLTFAIGAAAAWLMAQTSHETMIAGALLFWIASIADGIDGEMARLTLSESAYGEQLDTAVDHATHLLGYAGVMVGWWRQGIGPLGWTLAIGVGLAIPAVLLWSMHIVRSVRPERSFFVDTKAIEIGVVKAARSTRAPILRAAAAVFVLFRREAFSLTFFLVSLLTGARAIYPALIAAGLGVVAVTLVMYRRPIEDAIQSI